MNTGSEIDFSNSSCKRKECRSENARRRRNKNKKEKKQALKRMTYAKKQEVDIEKETTILDLQRENTILKRSLARMKPQMKRFNRSEHFNSSLTRLLKDKSSSVIKKFHRQLPTFKSRDIRFDEILLGEGVFGCVKRGTILSIQQRVAIKCLSAKNSAKHFLAEALISSEMSSIPYFLYFFGVVQPNMLLMEYVQNALTLREIIKQESPMVNWKNICVSLVHGLHSLHLKGILHNDLHANNILIRNEMYVKIIDFGKATLIEDPVVYSIKKGSEKQRLYNKIHCHLAFELRNVPGSKVSEESDIFSLGYNFEKVAVKVCQTKLSNIATKMICQDPQKRPTLSTVLLEISNLK